MAEGQCALSAPLPEDHQCAGVQVDLRSFEPKGFSYGTTNRLSHAPIYTELFCDGVIPCGHEGCSLDDGATTG
jgi:hypothetical protein